MSDTQENTLPAVRDDVRSWPALQGGQETFAELIKSITGPSGLTEFSGLDRYKTPVGSMTAWTTTDPLEGDKLIKAIEGILIYQDLKRAFYREDFEKTGGGNPPDCRSEDMEHGLGNPTSIIREDGTEHTVEVPRDAHGYLCASCPWSQFGSGRGGIGKRCAEIRRLFVLQPDSDFPIVLPLKPGSGAAGTPVFGYLIGLAKKRIDYRHVLTRLTLQKATAKQRGLEYAQVVPSVVRLLTPEECAEVDRVAAGWQRILMQTPATQEDLD